MGKETHRGELEKAIGDYLNKTGNALDSNGEEIKDVYLYAGLVGIPFSTLYRYICPAEDKIRILGNGERGKKKLISNDNIQFIRENFTRLDRANDGASRQEGTDYLMSTVTNLSRAQASRQLTRVVLPKFHEVGLLKKTVQKVQETTSDRIAISLPQQFRWHVAVDNAYKTLRETNLGLCCLLLLYFVLVVKRFGHILLVSSCHLLIVSLADMR